MIGNEFDEIYENSRKKIGSKVIAGMNKDQLYFNKFKRRFGNISEVVAHIQIMENYKEVIISDNREKYRFLELSMSQYGMN